MATSGITPEQLAECFAQAMKLEAGSTYCVALPADMEDSPDLATKLVETISPLADEAGVGLIFVAGYIGRLTWRMLGKLFLDLLLGPRLPIRLKPELRRPMRG